MGAKADIEQQIEDAAGALEDIAYEDFMARELGQDTNYEVLGDGSCVPVRLCPVCESWVPDCICVDR